MPTIIDALLYEIGFDTRGVNSGSKQVEGALNRASGAAKKTGSSLDDMGDRGAEAFDGMKRTALEFIAVLTAGKGIKSFTQYNTQSNVQLQNQARNIGINVKALSDWENVSRAFGGTAQDVAGSMQAIVSQAQTVSGRSNLALIFEQMGVSLFNANGQLRSMNSLMPDLAAAAQRLGPQKFMALATAAGISPGMVYMLEQGPQKIEALYKALQNYAVTPEQAQASADLLENWTLLTAQSESFGRTLLTDLTPGLDGLMGQISKIINENQKWIDQDIGELVKELSQDIKEIDWKKVSKDFHELVNGIENFDWKGLIQNVDGVAHAANVVADDLGGWRTALEIFTGVWIASKLGPLLLMIVAIGKAAGLTGKAIAALLKTSGADAAASSAAGGAASDAADAASAAVGFSLRGLIGRTFLPALLLFDAADKASEGVPINNSSYERKLEEGRNWLGTMKPWGDIEDSTPLPQMKQSQVSIAKQGVAYFMSQGWTKAQAVAIVANAMQESSLNPLAVNASGHHGLFQWDKERWAKLVAKYGPNPTTQQQFAFANSELSPGGDYASVGAQLRNTSDLYTATGLVNALYEVSGDDATPRMDWAHAISLIGAPAQPPPPTAPTALSPLQHAAAIAAAHQRLIETAHAASSVHTVTNSATTTITAPVVINAPNANPQAVGQSVKKHLQELQFKARQANMGLQ